jgi:hypothetical protein
MPAAVEMPAPVCTTTLCGAWRGEKGVSALLFLAGEAARGAPWHYE